MYSTIHEAWNNDVTELYSKNFKNNELKPLQSYQNNYFNINENYSSKPQPKQQPKLQPKPQPKLQIKPSISSTVSIKSKKKKNK